MKKLFVIVSLCLPFSIIAQQAVQNESVGFISYSESRVVALAEKFSEEQFNWRPAEGVRSVGEVMLHIASGNYWFMQVAGFATPEGVDPDNMETATKGKENVINTLKASYTFLRDGILKISDDQLADTVQLPFPGEHTKLTTVILGVDHTSEHLGQLIAYARMNGVTPPWSE